MKMMKRLDEWNTFMRTLGLWTRSNPETATRIFGDLLNNESSIVPGAMPDHVVHCMRAEAIRCGLPGEIAQDIQYERYYEVMVAGELPWDLVVRDTVGVSDHYVDGGPRANSVLYVVHNSGIPLDDVYQLGSIL